jgi:hypothetical protein
MSGTKPYLGWDHRTAANVIDGDRGGVGRRHLARGQDGHGQLRVPVRGSIPARELSAVARPLGGPAAGVNRNPATGGGRWLC